MMRTLVLVSFLCTCAGCASPDPNSVPDDWQLIKAEEDAFMFYAPPDLHPRAVRANGALVGEYASASMMLSFVYYRDADPMDGEGFERTSTTIDGRRAWIARKGDFMGVHFPRVKKDSMLTMEVRLQGADPKMVETIFQTIDFPE